VKSNPWPVELAMCNLSVLGASDAAPLLSIGTGLCNTIPVSWKSCAGEGGAARNLGCPPLLAFKPLLGWTPYFHRVLYRARIQTHRFSFVLWERRVVHRGGESV